MTPEETKALNGICPVCGKPLTIGVSYRVNELSDRKEIITPPATAGQTFSLVPLQEILAEILGVGTASKSVSAEYERLTSKFGSELSILREVPVDELKSHLHFWVKLYHALEKEKLLSRRGMMVNMEL